MDVDMYMWGRVPCRSLRIVSIAHTHKHMLLLLYTILYCTILHYTILYYITLYYTLLTAQPEPEPEPEAPVEEPVEEAPAVDQAAIDQAGVMTTDKKAAGGFNCCKSNDAVVDTKPSEKQIV